PGYRPAQTGATDFRSRGDQSDAWQLSHPHHNDGVIPSLHIDYKGTRIKQYHKAGQALRTETTINNTRDFYIGKTLCNLPAHANRLPSQPSPSPNATHHA